MGGSQKSGRKIRCYSILSPPVDPIGRPIRCGSTDWMDQTTWFLKHPVLDEMYDPENVDHTKSWTDYLVAEPVKVKNSIVSP